MLLDLQVGALREPVSGRVWDPAGVRGRVAARVARYRDAGLRPGERVFLHHGNRLEFFADLLAVWALGGCAVPIDARLTPFEVLTLAQAARPRLAVADTDLREDVAAALQGADVPQLQTREADAAPAASGGLPTPRLALDGDALVLFTSGTTGDPKGVVHTHRSLRARWTALEQSLGLQAFRRTLCLLPTHFGHGLICNCLFPWLRGADLYVAPPFQPDLVMRLGALIESHEITFLSSVPSLWRLALKTSKPPARQSLERVFCGSAPLSAHLWRRIRDWCGTSAVWNAYGITETGSWLAGTDLESFEPADGLVGRAWGGVLKVLDTGETGAALADARVCAPGETGHVWVDTPALMRGYLDRDDLTRRVVSQGWFATGDLGVLDERGVLTLRGREREEINKGGMKVHPADVDAVAERFPAVLDSCTFAVDDPHYGQNVGVALVLEPQDDETLRALHAWMREHLAEFQLPVRWWRVAAIPRTSRGKVNRAAVAQSCGQEAPLDLHRLLASGA